MEIAIYLNEEGQTTAIQEEGEIRIFQNKYGVWETSRTMPFCLKPSLGLKAMREYMQTALEFLGECRKFAALSISGLPYYELEKAGITIWEITGSSDSVLNTVMQAEDEPAPSLPRSEITVPAPKELSPGCYSISIKEIQNCNGQVTSKKVLLPLLQRMNFNALEIICNHIPPWLEEKILTGQLSACINKQENLDIVITIRN